MKEIKINFDPKFCQQVGKVPVFNEKNASTCTHIMVIPFDKNLGKHVLYGSEEQLRNADPVTMKRLLRGEPMRNKYKE